MVITALEVKELYLLLIIFVLRDIIVLLNLLNLPDVSQELTKMNLEQTSVKLAQRGSTVIPHCLQLFHLTIHLVQLAITALKEQDMQMNLPALWVCLATRHNL